MSHLATQDFSHKYTYSLYVSQPRSRARPASRMQLQKICVAQGLKSSLVTQKHTYFRKNRVKNRPTSLFQFPFLGFRVEAF